jgi:hypothetical protein
MAIMSRAASVQYWGGRGGSTRPREKGVEARGEKLENERKKEAQHKEGF